MSDVLTEMCVLGGCAAHRAITDACKHCGNYRAEIERRRALPLTDGTDGLRFKCVSQNLQTQALKGGQHEPKTRKTEAP